MALLAALLSSCATGHNPLAKWERSRNFNERQPVLIVLHYTTEESSEKSLHTLKTANSKGPVGVHYLVGRDGRLFQLVKDGKRAWHAGGGRWGTITDVNSASIGIELDNSGHDPFPDVQVDKLIVLLNDLTQRLAIPRRQVIGHEDMAPGRKIDPGPLFPWKRLYEAGFGMWPDPDAGEPPPGFDGWLAMAAIGYPSLPRHREPGRRTGSRGSAYPVFADAATGHAAACEIAIGVPATERPNVRRGT